MSTRFSLRVATTAALAAVLSTVPSAQVPFGQIRDILGAGGPHGAGSDSPVTTSLGRAVTAVEALDRFEPAVWQPLQDQPQDGSGAFHLMPGAYDFQAASYCLHAGTHGPGGGEGYLYAPLEGSRRAVIRAILQNSVGHREIPQQEIQVLLWAILARTSLHQMPRPAQAAAARLLTPGELLELGGASFRAVTPGIWSGGGQALPPAVSRVLQAEAQLRQLFTRDDTPYAELERVAVLLGDPEPDPGWRDVPRGRWSSHPDGYFIRFFPSGYDKTRIQVYVPEPRAVARDGLSAFSFSSRAGIPGEASIGSSDAIPFNPVGAVRVDLSESVAVPAARGRQRLAMSARAH